MKLWQATGDAVYSALFEAAPSLQHLYKTPRAVQGMKFAMSIALIISKLRQPVACQEIGVFDEFSMSFHMFSCNFQPF